MQPNLLSIPSTRGGTARPTVFPYGPPERQSHWPDAPGPTTCPDCGDVAVDVQGIQDCPGCAWTSHARDH